MKGRLASWLLAVLLLVGLAGSQALYDRANQVPYERLQRLIITQSEPLVPPVPVLKTLSFGNPSIAADLLWLQTIQYFGSAYRTDSFPSLTPLLTTITDLDSKFEYPYEFGLVVLPFFNQADTAIALGEKAQKELPANGLLSFYLATDYQLNFKDYRKAAHYYQKAALEPGAPAAAKLLAGISLSQLSSLNDRQLAIAFWETAAENAKNDDDRQRDLQWADHMKLVLALEQQAARYKEHFGHFPGSFQEMVKAGYLTGLPVSPLNRELDLDPGTGRISFDKSAQ